MLFLGELNCLGRTAENMTLFGSSGWPGLAAFLPLAGLYCPQLCRLLLYVLYFLKYQFGKNHPSPGCYTSCVTGATGSKLLPILPLTDFY